MKTATGKRGLPPDKSIAQKKILLLGIGNILMSDEGLGVRALEAVKDGCRPPSGVRCVDGGTMGLALLELIKEFPFVIIIDALKSGSRPGTILKLRGRDTPASVGLCSSAHGLGIKELIALAEFEGFNPDITIIGMEPKDISPGLKLTPVVKKRLPLLVKAVIRELGRIGVNTEGNRRDA